MINILEIVNRSLRQVTLFGIQGNGRHIAHHPLLELEYNQYKLDMRDASQHLIQNIPNNIEIDKFGLSTLNPRSGYFATLLIELSIKEDKTPIVSTVSLTPPEVYEQNKSSVRCVRCNKPTTQVAVLSSMINYCKSCSG